MAKIVIHDGIDPAKAVELARLFQLDKPTESGIWHGTIYGPSWGRAGHAFVYRTKAGTVVVRPAGDGDAARTEG